MHRFTNILVLVQDESPSPSAMARLVALARRHGARMKLMSVVKPFPWYTRLLLPASDELQRAQSEHIAERLRSLADTVKQKDLEITTKVAEGRRALEVIREVLRSEPEHDLVIKVAEPDPGSLFGSVDMRLLRNCPCPVWLLHPGMQDRSLRRILVAVDPSPAPDTPEELLHLSKESRPEERALNLKLMELASGLAASEGAELHLLHAWSAPGEDLLRVEGRLPREDVAEYVATLHEEARKALGRLIARFPDEAPRPHVHQIKGRPADVITEFIKAQDCDLVVMGTVVRTGIPGLLIGNTAETVFHRIDCSVLAAKPDGFVSPVSLEKGPLHP